MPVKWLSRQKCLKLLEISIYGRLATCDAHQQPYITPLNYVLINNKIFFHCGNEGRKLENIRNNQKVCFEISRHGKLYAAPRANNFSMRFWSVLVFGKASQVNDVNKKLFILNKLMEKYASNYDYVPLTLEDMKSCNLIEIKIDEITGKVSVDPK